MVNERYRQVSVLNSSESAPYAATTSDELAGQGDKESPSLAVDSGNRAPSGAKRTGRVIREIAETIVPAIIIALLIHVFLAQATRVYGQSMEPNLHTDMRLVVEKLSYRLHPPTQGDIVVLRVKPGDELLIKRIIGLPGDEVAIHDGQVYVNGEALDEPYLNQNTRGNLAPRVVPPLHVFVMGDNRRASNDSRSFGPVHMDNIVGRAWFSYWPVQDIGPLD